MKTIQLKTNFPKVMGDLAYQNHWLRLGMMFCLVVTALSLVITTASLRRRPTIIAIDQAANVEPLTDLPSPEDQAGQAVRKYIASRYVWDTASLTDHLSRAKAFVAPQSMKAFEKTISDLLLFSKGKTIGQRVYLTSVHPDPKSNQVQVVGDRFDDIQGLKAASILRVNLTYQSGPRTLENPWGVYVVKEDEIQ